MRWSGLLVFCAAASVAAALATAAQAIIPPPGPDLGVAGGGYTLNFPGSPNVEWNRARFEFALRESQATGEVRGKSLTVRVLGFDFVTKFVLRSWTLTPGYAGIPAYPGSGARVSPCSLLVLASPGGGPMLLRFSGVADVFTLVGDTEVPYAPMPQMPYTMDMMGGANTIQMSTPATPPFPLPKGALASGNLGGTDGVKAPGCAGGVQP